ncbi:PREDICTED: protein Jade-1 [Ipomoea nil]|uniref:protein Jade-1 n=1 Tax=Ipomoea nil TaxID=35883 RepID=UPI0009017323|nr:PREDICTED: protein Jade-1 [Ipomoea nil]
MGGKLEALPPLKRFILMQKHQENGAVVSSDLPAKKRKHFPDQPLPSPCCLPAKKRVWAINPLDLNQEYNPLFDAQIEEKQILHAPENQEPEQLADEEEAQEPETNGGDDDDDGIVCAICESTDGDPSDPIVLCDGCDLMVHTTCYGHPFTNGVPEGDWFCAHCLAKPQTPSCSLCPLPGGALKPTTDGKWAHLVCALFVPEVFFTDPEGREGINCSKVPNRRWERKCYICKSRNGCAIDCSEPKCPLAFHVTCGLEQDLCIEYNQGRTTNGAIVAGFCRAHSDLWKKQQQTGKFKIVARDEKEK